MVRSLLFSSLLVYALSSGLAVANNKSCTDREAAVRHLQGKFSETPAALGLTNSGGILEVLTSDAGRSWTILVTTPDGNSCLVATGEAWKSLPPIAALHQGF